MGNQFSDKKLFLRHFQLIHIKNADPSRDQFNLWYDTNKLEADYIVGKFHDFCYNISLQYVQHEWELAKRISLAKNLAHQFLHFFEYTEFPLYQGKELKNNSLNVQCEAENGTLGKISKSIEAGLACKLCYTKFSSKSKLIRHMANATCSKPCPKCLPSSVKYKYRWRHTKYNCSKNHPKI